MSVFILLFCHFISLGVIIMVYAAVKFLLDECSRAYCSRLLEEIHVPSAIDLLLDECSRAYCSRNVAG